MRRGRYLRLLATGVLSVLVITGLAPASASSANISHSYNATQSITDGSIVSLDPQHSDYVQLSNIDNGSRLLGIAVASDDSLLAVDATPGAVQVATSGNANVLVSNVNGDIHVGDQISVSPFNGLGMKAIPGSRIIGLAQTAFNSGSKGATAQEATDKNGKSSEVEVGYISVSIAIGVNATSSNTANLNELQKLAASLTGRTVPTYRVVISLVITAVALLSLIILIYASIYSSIISIGRNPLAKYAVFRTLGSVLAVALLTASIASLTIFFLLR